MAKYNGKNIPEDLLSYDNSQNGKLGDVSLLIDILIPVLSLIILRINYSINCLVEMRCCCGLFPSSATTKSSEAGIKDLFHPTIIRHRTFNMFYQWMAVTLAYYGLTFSSTDLAGDPYSNFCSSVAIEIPGRSMLAI